MLSRKFFRDPCNRRTLGVSFLVLLLGLIGTAFGDGPREHNRLPRPPSPPPQAVRTDPKFHAIPDSKLEIRAMAYDGSVNGKLTVQVRNAGKSAQKFSAAGLYFVPDGNPDTAPQRLGAVGPMQLTQGEAKETSELVVAPGQTIEAKLDVFCIDSHRSAPTSQNVFHVGVTKMPRELTTTIEGHAEAAVQAKRAAGDAAPRPAAKGDIQSEVWKSRDAKWIRLDGEGAQEAGK